MLLLILIGVLFLLQGCDRRGRNDMAAQERNREPSFFAPLVFWYWNNAAVSKEGITADLEAMKAVGLEGAYLFFIRGATDPPQVEPPAVQLTPRWWEMVRFAFAEARRLGLRLGLHACDGFTVAGGPWITPEMSMQKVVWRDTLVTGPTVFTGRLRQPETRLNYYRDICTYAFPVPEDAGFSSSLMNPEITTDLEGDNPRVPGDQASTVWFRSDTPCYLQFRFEKPFLCRSVVMKKGGNSYQSSRLKLEVSDDGEHFTPHTRLIPHRQGWMDGEADITFAVEPVKARFFRFSYDPEGSEPGAEDLDGAKWRPSLKMTGIELSSTPMIHQYEGKNGSIWRIARRTTPLQLPDSLYVNPGEIRDITSFMDEDGMLRWQVPPGKWRILRMGHTSTGKTNYIGGGAIGPECDKLNPEAAALQFDKWLGEFYRQVPAGDIGEVLRYFHVDSWECGSQNWSPQFAGEFRKRRGYDLIPLLPVFAGVPIRNSAFSENLLHDIRITIAEMVTDNFYGTLERLSREKNLHFSAESMAPVMVSDAMLHFRNVEIPMGEFWWNSPTHDKPNDILDAVSAAHIYGKKIVQAESFTEIRLDWDEYPGLLKRLGDRNFALGVNRLVFHVFTHNPWVERMPGMTTGVVGLFFQPAQTWFCPAEAWMEYLRNCQERLQEGIPVTDIAVFTGEELPRRALLPDRLVPLLPGIFGRETVSREAERLANRGNPLQERPRGVTSQQNIADPSCWVDPLRGYGYDSFNRDALLRLMRVKKGRVELPGGASYALLVIPGSRRMMPDGHVMSMEVARKLLQLVKAGATIILEEKPVEAFSNPSSGSREFRKIIGELTGGEFETCDDGLFRMKKVGRGRVILGKYGAPSFENIGLDRDFFAREDSAERAPRFAWTHRRSRSKDVWFVSNQENRPRKAELSFRISGKQPELYDPVTGLVKPCGSWRTEGGRTILPLRFEAGESFFVIFEKESSLEQGNGGKNWSLFEPADTLEGGWTVTFDPVWGGPPLPVEFAELHDWTESEDARIRYYSGSAVYRKSFVWTSSPAGRQAIFVDLGQVNNLAEVSLNGISCGTVWTPPFRADISGALRRGSNELEITVTNTWANRLAGDHALPEEERVTQTTAPWRLEGCPLLPAGMKGPVTLVRELR
ncbi:MAG TPA: glycosyl hydrolase [Prolixibacteraceae bacterium]|jgi:hypothetical protein|nr:DNA-binding protein [Bacteroidales bacterium]HNZ68919.1 glycosyl hydrolase [Prolixibacteraceae bacterium]HOC85780.1 glycosyl hydrolase [Prolixibacteraceae bacterium]HOG95225.1 glycosyl hydrolase [Prolixibacteraceae bacterium]HOY91929.1 glycosyl hydrolase [Prolixibacteraceae bacterium]